MTCKECQDKLVAFGYKESHSDDQAMIAKHLNACKACAAVYREIQHTQSIMSQRSRPAADPAFLEALWPQLEAQIARHEDAEAPQQSTTFWQNLQRWWRTQRRMALQMSGALAILVLGIFLGKTYFSERLPDENPAVRQHSPALIQQAALEARSERYLTRSKTLLIGLVNFDPNDGDLYSLNLPYQKEKSKELIKEAKSLKGALKHPGQERLRTLVEDLERTLLALANLEKEHDFMAIDMVRDAVENKGLLMKINLYELQNGTREPASATQSSEARSQL